MPRAVRKLMFATNRFSHEASGGFETLNWMPDGDVRGSYSVKTKEQSGMAMDFTIIGVMDADGDGKFATYTATKSVNPVKTNKDIY